MLKLSKASKMRVKGKQIYSLDFEAGKTCPGSYNPDGSIVEVCKNCYAKKGSFRWAVVKKVRTDNLEDIKRAEWVTDMVKLVSKERFFRWLASGDIISAAIAEKIYEVILSTPKTLHWLPTRSYKIPKILKVLDRINKLPNVAIRYSADDIGLDKFHITNLGAFVIKQEDIAKARDLNIVVCPASIYKDKKNCGSCTACWDKTLKIAYVEH